MGNQSKIGRKAFLSGRAGRWHRRALRARWKMRVRGVPTVRKAVVGKDGVLKFVYDPPLIREYHPAAAQP